MTPLPRRFLGPMNQSVETSTIAALAYGDANSRVGMIFSRTEKIYCAEISAQNIDLPIGLMPRHLRHRAQRRTTHRETRAREEPGRLPKLAGWGDVRRQPSANP